MKCADLSCASPCGSEDGIFILLHTHSDTRARHIHPIRVRCSRSEIAVLLALSDSFGHICSSTQINIILSAFADLAMRILLRKLKSIATHHGPILLIGVLLAGKLPAPSTEIGSIRILHLHLSVRLIRRLLQLVSEEVRVLGLAGEWGRVVVLDVR